MSGKRNKERRRAERALLQYESTGNAGQGLAGIPTTQKDKTQQGKILLALNGMEKFQKRLAFGENRRKNKRKNFRRDGMQVTDEGVDPTKANDSIRGVRCWMISDTDADGKPLRNVCIDCGSNNAFVKDVWGTELKEPAPGATVVGGSYVREDLGLREGDVIMYWICATCMENLMKSQEGELTPPDEDNVVLDQYGTVIDGKTPVLLDQYGNDIMGEIENRECDKFLEDRGERLFKNAYAWIDNAKLRGYKYKVMGADEWDNS